MNIQAFGVWDMLLNAMAVLSTGLCEVEVSHEQISLVTLV
jgi:hypothetical protein